MALGLYHHIHGIQWNERFTAICRHVLDKYLCPLFSLNDSDEWVT